MLVTVAADSLKNPGKSAAFLAFIRGRQFTSRFGDQSEWKHIGAAIRTSIRRESIGFFQEAQTQ
jgi:hypothetical protein